MVNNITKKPLVSIVLPTYKRAHVLPYAIGSVLRQTYENWELIVVDDNSHDNTPEVVKSFADERIRYVRNEPNLKLPRALNKGFSLARGDYLTWTSDDNLFADVSIEKMVERLRHGDCDLAYADYYLFADIDAAGNALEKRHEKLPSKLQLEKGNHIGACFLYTRKAYEAVGDYDPELFLVEDYDYFMRIAKKFKACHIGEPIYYFRRHDDALFCSRYAEVRASDVLVRYKNGYIDDDEALNVVVELVLQNADNLKSPLLHWSRILAKALSYRLTQANLRYCRHQLRTRLEADVKALLASFRGQKQSFKETKEGLMNLMQREGAVEYVRPAFLKSGPTAAN